MLSVPIKMIIKKAFQENSLPKIYLSAFVFLEYSLQIACATIIRTKEMILPIVKCARNLKKNSKFACFSNKKSSNLSMKVCDCALSKLTV